LFVNNEKILLKIYEALFPPVRTEPTEPSKSIFEEEKLSLLPELSENPYMS
jgi:hypothetical protein